MSFLVYEEDKRKRRHLVQILEKIIRERSEKTDIYCVESLEEALDILDRDRIEAAFISWEDALGQGFFLSRNLVQKERRINIIAMAETYKYMREFWKWHVSGYITGKVTRQKVQEELDNLRNSPYWEKEYDYSFYEQ